MTDRDGRFLFGKQGLPARGRTTTRLARRLIPSDLVIREDKADCRRRAPLCARCERGRRASRCGSRTSPEDPVSLSIAGVRGLGEGGGDPRASRIRRQERG